VRSVRITAVAAGGAGIAREPSGRVLFVEGALPGELVVAELTAERRDHARAVAVEVVEPAPGRVTPPCPWVAAGCGGCGWQHVSPAVQRELKSQVVADALRRLSGVTDPAAGSGPVLATAGYRTTLRGVADEEGRFALRAHRSHDLVAVPTCLVAHPLVAEVLAEGRFPPAAGVTVRVGARTGERLVVVDGPGTGPQGGADEARVVVPEGVRVVAGAELAAGRRAWLHEEVAGVRLRVSARSFFQAGPEAAEALVAAVADAAGPLGPDDRVADLYGGVGLFAATVGRGARTVLVEASAAATADARINLRGTDRPARVVRSDVARWRPRRMDLVIADPPRVGLGRGGARTVAGTHARRVMLVSCDAGSLGRDVALLRAAGYRWVSSTLVDAFPHTPHVEVVTRLDRD
jgi:23S rRNA (uracil1939-C5)-methyltransferase